MRWITLLLITASTHTIAEPDDLELSYLTAAMPETLAQYGSFEVAAFENLAIIEDGDATYLELRMLPNQPVVNKGYRSELSIDAPYNEGATIVYEWRLRIPEHSQTDAENRWWLLAQWHDQPDLRIGESWDGFSLKSPPVALGYGNIDGEDTISLYYGAPEQTAIAYQSLTRGVWHTIRAEINWSTSDRGWADIYLDDMETPFAQATGPNMHNSFQHYFKLGMYRDPAIQVGSQIQLDDISMKITPN